MNPYLEFKCLYTSQKQKKAKTWQDGHLRYFHNNSKVVLYDAKFIALDSTFHRGAAIATGDDMDMDKHLIQVDDFTTTCAGNPADQRAISNSVSAAPTRKFPVFPRRAAPHSIPATTSTRTLTVGFSSSSGITHIPAQRPPNDTHDILTSTPQLQLKRKKWRPPAPASDPSASSTLDSQSMEKDWEAFNNEELQAAFSDSMEDFQETMTNPIAATAMMNARANIATPTATATATRTTSTTTAKPAPTPKRRKVGLSRVSSAPTTAGQPLVVSPHRPPSTQLEFPNAARCTNFTGKNSGQLLRRSMTLGSRFMSTNQYKDGMTYLIYEHLQIMVIEIAVTMWSIKSGATTREGEALDTLYRSRGIHMHSGSSLRRRGDVYSGFPKYSERNSKVSTETTAGGPNVVAVQTAAQQGVSLSISNKEHHSKYSKDDLWVVSATSRFDAASSFFARSVFFGPSGSDVELICLSPKDSSTARDMCMHSTGVCAIRLFNGMSEFMMLDNLSDNLIRTPLLPVLLNYVPPELVKASRTSVFKAPSRVPEKSGCVVLTEEDGIDVEVEIQETIEQYSLNEEQAEVLRSFAQTVIRAPGWVAKSADTPPVLLVHGVFGAGKSFLIAVLIVFIDSIIDKARPLPKEERSCRFLVSSMTNVAVDRILMALLDLNYTKFVRVGSLKKVARRVLPYTAQSTTGRSGEDIKELQLILDDDSLSVRERHYVKDALKKFQKQENRGIVKGANVVGVTCVASTFEVLEDVSFPIVILDEASQLLEAMSLIPICRAGAEKLIMVGDPLQLSPPINTNADKASSGKGGLSRTLFDRSTEMGLKPVMLRTQYRCHQRIADISNTLFYSNVLHTGTNPEDRAPLIEGLPTLTFVDNSGQEIQNSRTKSYTNPAEIRLVVAFIRRLLSLNIPEASIGVISLYKSQADGIQAELSEQLKNTGLKGSVQISTVDAFQGSEKDVIIVSTVRTDSIGFIDNHQRVNVALTRSKRHLFIVGNSQLLSSNSVWGPVIKDHCSNSPDGFMRGDQFAQRLKTLGPLPRQVEVEQQSLLESESDEEDAQQDDYEKGNLLQGTHASDEEDDDDDDDEVVLGNSGNKSAPARGYMHYEDDEDDSADSYDERGVAKSQKQPAAPAGRHHNDEGGQRAHLLSDPHSVVPAAPRNTILERPETWSKVGFIDSAHPSDAHSISKVQAPPQTGQKPARTDLSAIRKQQQEQEQDEPFIAPERRDIQWEREQEQIYQLSMEGVSQLEDTLADAFEDNSPSRKTLFVEKRRTEQNLKTIKIQQEPMQGIEDPEDEGEVLWEMEMDGEEEPDETNKVLHEAPEAMKSEIFIQTPHGASWSARELHSSRDPNQSWQPRNNSTASAATSTTVAATTTIGALCQSQRIEDLDVAGWSQMVPKDLPETLSTVVHAPMSVPSDLSRGWTAIESDFEEDEDDIACLEVGDLDMI